MENYVHVKMVVLFVVKTCQDGRSLLRKELLFESSRKKFLLADGGRHHQRHRRYHVPGTGKPV